MKTIKVVAAVICDSIKVKNHILQQLEDMENLRASGSFQVVKLKTEKLRK